MCLQISTDCIVAGKVTGIHAWISPWLHEAVAPRLTRDSANEGGNVVSHRHLPPLLPIRHPWHSVPLEVECG